MHVLLISANTETINMPTPPMGLGSIAAALDAAGHAVAFLDLMAVENWQPILSEALTRPQPDLIGISIRNIDDQARVRPRFLLEEARKVVGFCRRHAKVPVVLGGAGYSIFPQSVLDYTQADMGIQGEGENAMAILVDRLQSGGSLASVPGLYLRAGGAQAPRVYERHLDRMPLPGPERFDTRLAADPNFYLPIQTRRGCPLACSYCSTAAIEGRLIRKRSPDAVVAALSRWRRAGFRRFFFVDNIFNLPVGYARTLCARIAAARLDIHWRCILYPGQVDRDLVQAMAAAGCREVSLGFESGCQTILDAMNKRFATDDIVRSSRLLAEHGIRRMGFLLLGGPGETRETVHRSLAFTDALDLDAVKVTVGIRIYPHTSLARLAVQEGVVTPEDDLLHPRFYLVEDLEDGLEDRIREWLADRPNWIL